MKKKLITVSFRLPYRLAVAQSKLTISASVGGLATALRSYFDIKEADEANSFHWVGVSDVSKKVFDRVSAETPIKKGSILMHPIFLPMQKTKELFYDGFCNSVIWPLFLYFPSFVVYKKEYFDEYVAANKLMCEKLKRIYQPGDTILVHDYHWMLLPAMLREELPEASIGFFLHIPFPSFELYRLLPKTWRRHLILGLLGADVVGFQTEEYARHFIDSVNHILPDLTQEDRSFRVNGRSTLIKSCPISIDYKKFSKTAETVNTKKSIKRMRGRLKTEKLLLSVDRLDYTKAVFNRLEAFDIFLEQHNEFREKVTYLLIMVPSRESILKYKENKMNVEALISRINGKFGTIGWTPVVYHYQTVDFNKLVALYGAADIALVVPSRDGMNLVAKEYIACRASKDGVLILSETAGAADELADAILVNPNDRQEVADSILKGLTMPVQEQRKRVEKMQHRISSNDVVEWASELLYSLKNAGNYVEVEI